MLSVIPTPSRRTVLAAWIATTGALLPVLGAEPDLSSPRAVFDTFLGAMIDVKQGQSERIDDAVACLDLSSVPGLVRDAAPGIAGDLKTYLDKTELIDVRRLPLEVDGDTWVYRRTSAGEVSLVRTEDGRWLFSRATIDSLPSLLDSVRDRGFVAGIEGGGGAPRTAADWLRNRVPSVLRGRAFIVENWQWLALAVLVFVGVVLDRLIRLMLGAWVRRLLAASSHLREKGLTASFGKPVGILAMALFWQLTLRLLDLPLNALAALTLAAQLVMAAAAVWGIYRLVDLLSAHFAALAARTESRIDDILIPLIRRAVKIVVLAFVILFIAQNLDIDITSLLAGLGIGGIAFALAAKDTVENLFGSITVLIDRPFQIGDWVVIGEDEGTVEEIGFRSTRLRTFYNSRITIPNSRLVNNCVDNLGARRYRRVKCMIGIQYDTPPEKIEAFCEGIRELIRRHPYTRKDYYMVYFNAFAESSFEILLYVFHEAPDWATELRERHRLFLDIVRLAHRLGVEFAFPTRTLHVSSVPPQLGGGADTPAVADSGPGPVSADDLVRLGRAEAEAIVEGHWPGAIQGPVSFDDPERIRPGRGAGPENS
jgi:MscS family membrane protein